MQQERLKILKILFLFLSKIFNIFCIELKKNRIIYKKKIIQVYIIVKINNFYRES